MEQQRTKSQNRSEHKLFQEAANECVAHGITMKPILEACDIYPTSHTMKDIFREIGRVKFGKESTADLTTVENMQVAEEFIKILSDVSQGNIALVFPSQFQSEEYLENL